MSEQQITPEEEIRLLKEELASKTVECEKLRTILVHAFPEKSGALFVCGVGETEEGGELPMHLLVSPAYGADVRDTVVYELKRS